MAVDGNALRMAKLHLNVCAWCAGEKTRHEHGEPPFVCVAVRALLALHDEAERMRPVCEAAERRADIWRSTTANPDGILSPNAADELCDSDDALADAVDQMRAACIAEEEG
jgi:hypothetical protein